MANLVKPEWRNYFGIFGSLSVHDLNLNTYTRTMKSGKICGEVSPIQVHGRQVDFVG